jgi:DsbC/DsbD-like thiol-disulfide interchange protein
VTDAGFGVAAISYDPVETLKAFADKHTITFPLLSDAGSKTITAWGLLNKDATGRTAGIPHPGTFMIDRAGRILSRTFEQPYQERRSATSLLAQLAVGTPGQATTLKGGQATFVLSASDSVAAVGHRVTLSIRVTPGPKMHVYAPGQKGYIPIALTLTPDAAFSIHPLRFPASTTYHYKPLNETVQVYSAPFTLTQDVTIALTPDTRARATRGEVLTVRGELEYQACDDSVCYRPETIPVEWKVTLSPIVR